MEFANNFAFNKQFHNESQPQAWMYTRNTFTYTCKVLPVWRVELLAAQQNLLFYRFQRKEWLNNKNVDNNKADTNQFGTLLFGCADFLFIFSEKTRKTSPKIWSSQSLPNMCIVVLVVFLLPVNFLRIFFREQDWKIYFFTKLKNKQAIFCWLSVLLIGHRRRCRWVPHNALLADSQAR